MTMRAAPLVLLLLGCQPLADPSYRGEVLGLVAGTITSEISPPPPAEVLLLWINWKSDPGTVLGTRAAVEGSFPSRFRVELYDPPPDSALNVLPPAVEGHTEPLLGIAWLVVLAQGATPALNRELSHADVKGLSQGAVLGWAEDDVMAWVSEDAAAGSFAAEILGGPAARGFHLMRASGKSSADIEAVRACRARGDTCPPLISGLVPAGIGEDVPIRLTRQLEGLRVPVFALPPKVEEAFGIAGT